MFSQGIGYNQVYGGGFGFSRKAKIVNGSMINPGTGNYDIVPTDKDKLLVNADGTTMQLNQFSLANTNEQLEIVAYTIELNLFLADGAQVVNSGEVLENTEIKIPVGLKAILFKISDSKYILTFESQNSNTFRPLSSSYFVQIDNPGIVDVTEKYQATRRPDFSIVLKSLVLSSFGFDTTNGISVIPSMAYNPGTGSGWTVETNPSTGTVSLSLFNSGSQVNLATTASASLYIIILVW